MPKKIPRGFFITGTDTGVGKTIVAAGLAALFRESGLDVGVMKPIQTGCVARRGERIAADARILLRAAETHDPMDQVCPYRLKAPLAPLVAAEMEGTSIDLGRIETAYRKLLKRHPIMVVEGIGGLLTPITSTLTAIDLSHRMNLPLIIVSTTRLGTLNHTLLTVRWARHAGATVLGVIFNRPDPAPRGPAEKTNPAVFAELDSAPVLGTIPYLKGLDVESERLGGVRNVGHYLKKGIHHLGIKLNP